MVIVIIFYALFLLIFGYLFTSFGLLWRCFLWLFVLSLGVFLYLLFEYHYLAMAVWVVFVALASIISIPILRRFIISYPLFDYAKKQNIKISATEEIAINSGDTHWERCLFSNNLNWQQLIATKTIKLTKDEQDFIANQTEQLCELFLINGMGNEVIAFIKEHKFWALIITKKYGGLGFSPLAHSKIISKLASCDVALSVTVMVPNSLGPAELLSHYGTKAQKDYYLPRLAKGVEVPCFALTSVVAGSDAAAISDTGVVCYGEYNGKKVLGLRLNWQKRYTTLAPIATIIGLAFKVFDPEHLLSNKEDLGITCALIAANTTGISIGRFHKPMGLKFANGPHSGVDVFVPIDCVIGGKEYIGRGWEMLMQSLSAGRGISLPSLSIAGAGLCLKTSLEYSHIRQQFHQPIVRFQGIYEKICAMAGELYMMQAMTNFNIDALALGLRPSVISAILKYNHTQTLRTITNDAMDIHGGKTVMLGDSNYLASLYQSLPIAITVEGANIMTRSFLVYGQGLMRCHPFLYGYIKALANNNKRQFDKLLTEHFGYLWHTKISVFTYAISAGIFVKTPKTTPSVCKQYYRRLGVLSASFAFLSELALIKFGNKLKFNESLSALFADLLTTMYGISSVLRTFNNSNNKDLEQNLLHYVCQTKTHQAQLLVLQISNYFASGFLIKLLVLPFGLNYKPSKQKLEKKVIKQLSGKLKLLLTKDVFVSKNLTEHPLTKLETAYNLLQSQENEEMLKILIEKILQVDDYRQI